MSLFTLLWIIWGAITVAFLCIFAWKSLLGTREEDVVYLGPAESSRATEQQQIVAKELKLIFWAKITGFTSLGLLLALVVLWGYRAFNVLPS
jgi:hypothetical protein